VPKSLKESSSVPMTLTSETYPINSELDKVFPTLLKNSMKYYELKPDYKDGKLIKSDKPLTIGCVLSGGQASGGHNVIMGLFDMVK
jgi:hypothetical protein